MPLVKCPDCSNDVSDKASACPKCGHPIAAQTVPPVPVMVSSPSTPTPPPPPAKSFRHEIKTVIVKNTTTKKPISGGKLTITDSGISGCLFLNMKAIDICRTNDIKKLSNRGTFGGGAIWVVSTSNATFEFSATGINTSSLARAMRDVAELLGLHIETAIPEKKDRRSLALVFGAMCLLTVGNVYPIFGIIMALAFIGWGIAGMVKEKKTLPSYVFSESSNIRVHGASTFFLGLFIFVIAAGNLSSQGKETRELEAANKVRLEQEKAQHIKAKEREVQLRKDLLLVAGQWDGDFSDVENLMSAGKIREAYIKLREAKEARAEYLALYPIPDELVSRIERHKSLEASLKPVAEFQIQLETAKSRYREAQEQIRSKSWILADTTLTEALSFLEKANEIASANNLEGALVTKREWEATQKRISPQVKKAQQKAIESAAYDAICGPKPSCGGWDGECAGIESALQKTAHDPDSIDVERCSQPMLTTKACWVTTCDVRGKNAFGALVLHKKRFSMSTLGIEEFE